ncbi:HEAT repeat domain-containing protein [Streptomyces sp. NPDC001941]|uniref:HEAT repeat domain-containing protein n=1 Tax=Streptomyces sp. NPDC001941 TaxID=3154659 RepID=UPI00332FFDBC
MTAGLSWEAVDSIAWRELAGSVPYEDAAAVPRALHRLARAGARATERDCQPLHCLIPFGSRSAPGLAAAALPFVVALASDPAMGARAHLTWLLADLRVPELAGEDWTGARELLADADPAVRRAAIPLVDGIPGLLERWRAEEDLSVRIPLLLALGELVAEETEAGRAGGAVAEARAVLDGVLAGDDPVLWAVAVDACTKLDPDLVARELDRLVDVLADPGLKSRIEDNWYETEFDDPHSVGLLLWGFYWSLASDPGTQLSLVSRLLDAARTTRDVTLYRVALDLAWCAMRDHASAEAAVLPMAGALVTHPDCTVRQRAANILAVLGPRSAPYADELAALLDDDSEDPLLDGSVREFARWALTRIGDPRAMPGLVAQLLAQTEEQGRGYGMGDPRRPEVVEVLVPLRAHAEDLLPELRAAMAQGRGVDAVLEALTAWGDEALPALPELVALLSEDERTGTVAAAARAIGALGPAAASALPALSARERREDGWPAYEIAAARVRVGGDREAAVRFFGEALRAPDGSRVGAVAALADLGPDAAPYAAEVRGVMDTSTGWSRLEAAGALWSITGRAEPGLRVLEECVLSIAEGDDSYGLFREALRALIRGGTLSPAIRTALETVRQSDRRLSDVGGYPMVIDDRDIRALVDQALACP